MEDFKTKRRLIECAGYQSMPWKNGLGSTTQIAIHPAHATFENFCWRVSMACVNTNGPFSQFPGTDRTLVVLEGPGIDLAFADGKLARLTGNSAPFTFAADIEVEAALIAGPILDLNVMTRRRDFSHRMQKFSGPAEWKAPASTIVIYARDTALRIDDGAQAVRVALGDTVVFDDAKQGVKILPESLGDYYLVQFTEIQSPG